MRISPIIKAQTRAKISRYAQNTIIYGTLAAMPFVCYKAHKNRQENVENEYAIITNPNLSEKDLQKVQSRVYSGQITWKEANDSIKRAAKGIKLNVVK